MLNYSDERIQRLIKDRKWKNADEFKCLKAIYNFVRDEILFGYNVDDSILASQKGLKNLKKRQRRSSSKNLII